MARPLLYALPMTDLEVQLMHVMIKLIVRYPDGLERIEASLNRVIEAGIEMAEGSESLAIAGARQS